MRFAYKGKLTGKDVQYYEAVKKDRSTYRSKLSDARRRVAFIKKILRGKELSAV